MIKRQPLKMTALALAAAQLALLYSGTAQAQTADPAATEGEGVTVVVTGQRKAMETAQRIKQEAEQIVDSVVADEAGKLPDKSITEVLQRVVGVTMDRNRSRSGSTLAANGLGFDVEGSGVQIRGLSWGSSTLNGRESFSAGWPGRELSWGDVPPELMAAVDVYKNPSAELVEGGVSGQINLRTRLPFDSKGQFGAFSASDNYSVLGKKNSPNVSGLYSNRWKTGIGEVGFLVDLSYGKSTSRYDSIEVSPYYPRTNVVAGKKVWVPVSASWGTGTGESERGGLYAALQWRNNDKESALTYFDSAFRSSSVSTNIFAGGENPYLTKYGSAAYDNNGVFQSGVLTYPLGGLGANQFADGGLAMGTTRNYNNARGRTRELAWNFKGRIDERWSYQTDLQWVHATNFGEGGMLNLGTYVPSMGVDLSGARPAFNFDEKSRNFLADAGNYYWDISQPDTQKAEADLYAWKTDGRFNFDHPVLRDLRFGVRLTERSSTKHKNSGTGWKSYSESWGVRATDVAGQLPKVSDLSWQRSNFGYLSDPRYAALGQVEQYAFPNFFNGRMSSPPTIVVPTLAMVKDKPAAYKNLLQALRLNCEIANGIKNTNNDCSTVGADWRPDGYDDSDPKLISEHSEGTQALYATLRFGFDDWKFPVEGNTGVRVVRTNTVAHGYTVFKPTYGERTPPSLPHFGEVDEPLDVKSSHIDLIPSLNLKMNLSPTLQSRLALSRGIYRPGFDQLQEYITLDQKVTTDAKGNVTMVTYTGNNSGNAKLKPLKSNNIDLSLEWYPQSGQSLTAVLFYKNVKDIVLSETYTRTFKSLGGSDQDFEITGPANAAKLWLGGIELAGSTYLEKLPGMAERLPDWAKGFGISANYTYIDGKQELYHPFKMDYCPSSATIATNLYGCDINGLPFKDLPLPYMSKSAFNVGFMYDRGPLSARLAYSWRARTLLATGVYGASGDKGTSADPTRQNADGSYPTDVRWGLPVWQEAVGQWDAGVNYRFSDHLWGSLNVSNLTEVVTRQTHQQAIGQTGRAWYDPGRSFRLSMGYTF